MIGVEIVLAPEADYLPTDPALEIGGTFGESTDPEMTFAVLGDSTAAGVGAGDPGPHLRDAARETDHGGGVSRSPRSVRRLRRTHP